jgi:hypothetical protein
MKSRDEVHVVWGPSEKQQTESTNDHLTEKVGANLKVRLDGGFYSDTYRLL